MLGWLQSYLKDRSFRVFFEGEQSSLKSIKSGVPQSSILSPLLFNVLMSDLPSAESVQMSVYADDLALFSVNRNPEAAWNNIQRHILNLNNWANKWGQQFNTEKKIKLMIFNKDRNVSIENFCGVFKDNIEVVDEFKFLGVTFDSPKLTWSKHINKLRATCNKRMSILKSVSHNHWGSDRNTMLTLFKSLI